MIKEIEFLKKQSLKAYELSRRAFEDGNYNWSIFLLEQAIQLLIKYLLALKIGHYSKTHKLSRLFEEISELYPEFYELYRKNRDKFTVIEDSYLLSRYLGKEYEKEDVEDKFKLFEELKKMVERYESC